MEPWLLSEFPHEARDAWDAVEALVRCPDEKLAALDPETLATPEYQGLYPWLKAKEAEPRDANFRVGMPQVFEWFQEFAMQTKDEALMRRTLWAMETFATWLKRLHDQQRAQEDEEA
jgi:hypothetical protein